MNYEHINFKMPQESTYYSESSDFTIQAVGDIIQNAIENGKNKIVINTNLKLGLPMENINKIAGPFVEAWAQETFESIQRNVNINIQLGDSLQKLQELNSNSVDLIIADPPYNLNKDYGNGSDSKNFDEYIRFTQKWTAEAKRVLKPNGTLYVFMGFKFISYLYQILEKNNNLHFINWICWHYTQGIGKKRGFSPRHDDILMFSKGKKYTFNLDSIRVPQKYYRSINNMRGSNPGDVWEFSHVHYCQENRQSHPTQKPEGLIERMVLASSNINDFVVDPFSGSGTTLRVCQQLQRNCLGIDLNSEYVEISRLKEPFTGFDSIDPKMERIPSDFTNKEIRAEYLKNHTIWFLKNNPQSIEKFRNAAHKKYPESAGEELQLFKDL